MSVKPEKNILKLLKYFRIISWNISWNILGQKISWNFTSLPGLPKGDNRMVISLHYKRVTDRNTDGKHAADGYVSLYNRPIQNYQMSTGRIKNQRMTLFDDVVYSIVSLNSCVVHSFWTQSFSSSDFLISWTSTFVRSLFICDWDNRM